MSEGQSVPVQGFAGGTGGQRQSARTLFLHEARLLRQKAEEYEAIAALLPEDHLLSGTWQQADAGLHVLFFEAKRNRPW